MDKRMRNKFERLLIRKRKGLYDSYRKKLSNSGESGVDGALDSVDEASANYNKEYWYSLSDADRRIMRQIDIALDLIKAGSYGECQNCGKQIQIKRLEAVPWARHCIECQDLQERGLL